MRFKISIVLMFAVMVFMGMYNNVFAEGLGVYSDGYRMGQLTKFSMKGMMIKSGEGQLLMGADSTPYSTKDGESVNVVNPWYFSSTKPDMQRQLNNLIGEYVVLKYTQARIKSPAVDTEYEISEIIPISDKVDDVCVATKFKDGAKSEGSRMGRIVKASNRGTLAKSWEIMIQQGSSGNQFKNVSITDDQALYDCAVKYLKAGQQVKLTYSESFFNISLSRDTNYDLLKIEPANSKTKLN